MNQPDLNRLLNKSIKEMMTAKVLLTGLAIGGDDAYYEKYEKEANETGEMD
jgi:hypothetical protein